MTLSDYLADAQQLIPPGQVVALIHRWQDRTGFRVRRQTPGRTQRVTYHRRLKVVVMPVVEADR